MPKQTTHVRVVREWCTSLGILTAVNVSRAEVEMKLAAFVPMLMREFPDRAFTADSLAFVARQCKFFPTYGELAHHLSTWWRDNRPQLPAIRADPPPPPPRPPPSDEERAHVAAVVAGLVRDLAAADPPQPHRWDAPLEPKPAPRAKPAPLTDKALAEAYRAAGVRNPREAA